jgi:glycosyltransferase involved in cell wall biosynthesis
VVSFSVLIITHGREDLLSKCLASLQPQGVEWQLILVANGAPLTEEIIQRAKILTPDFNLINLDSKETPGKARNIGLASAKYEWIFLIDDDAYVTANYFNIVFPLLARENIDILGGPDAPAKGMVSFSEALAITLASPFCTGMTFARHTSHGKEMVRASEEKITSSNLWIRKSILINNSFPEEYLTGEESALLLNVEKKGARIFYHPGLVVRRFRCKNLKALFTPTFNAGFFRSKLLRQQSGTKSWMFWLPTIFVILHFTIFFAPDLFWMLTRLYLGIILMMSLNLAARRNKIKLFFYIAFLHYFIVMTYGLGFLFNRMGRSYHKSL